jgi:hypothetical protein
MFTGVGLINGTVISVIVVYALTVSIAVNLIVDMDHPFTGFVKVSPVPLERALAEMTP